MPSRLKWITLFLLGSLLLLLTACTAGPAQQAVETTATPPPASATMVPTSTPNPPTPTPAAGQTRSDAAGIEQVWVPPGTFLMGTGDTSGLEPPDWAARELESEQPQHKVELTRGYWIDKYEVTNRAYQAFIEDGGYLEKEYWSEAGWTWLAKQNAARLPFKCLSDPPPDHPQVCVTWYEADAYARWRGGRLPTEAEWEYAARGPDSLIYPWGNMWDPAKANVVDSTSLTPVGSFPEGVSWVGAFDMSGNAMEWVQDWLDTRYYEQGDMVDPPGPATGGRKIEKGGWWGSHPFVARAAYRHFEDPPGYQDHHIGFRVVAPQEME